MERYEGTFCEFFETGTEGVLWVLEASRVSGYEGLVVLQMGDEIEIYDPVGNPVYRGVISPEHNIKTMGRPSGVMQPVSNGRWVHWIQSGVDPDLWGSWFFKGVYTGTIERKSRPGH